jgi:1-acyl-sn-glycerol-3-phosphate acyltransferase
MFRWFVSCVVSVIFLFPWILVGFVNHRLGDRFFSSWAKIQRWIFGIEVSLTDENMGNYLNEPYVYVLLNQTSLVEIIIWPPEIPTTFFTLMNLEFSLLPIPGWPMLLSRHLVVIRQWRWQANWVGKKIVELLKSGQNFAISIEGRRSETGKLSSYKKGAVVSAILSGATIIPFTLKGATDLMPYGAWRIRPGKVHVRIHRAIPTRGLSYEDRNQLVDQLRKIAESELVD